MGRNAAGNGCFDGRDREPPPHGSAPALDADDHGCCCARIFTALTGSQWRQLGRRLDISMQQCDILRLMLLEDLKPPAIAERLGVNLCTIKTQTQRMFKSVNVHSRNALFMRALRVAEEMQEDRPPPEGG